MKCFLLAGFLIIFGAVPLAAQDIKRIKISELDNYLQQADHPLILNFWATYCQPCLKEIPYFEKIVGEHSGEKIELILVSVDPPRTGPSKISAFVKAKKFNSAVWWLDENNPDYFCPKVDKKWSGGIPASLFINNKTHYRKFFDRQLTDLQMEEAVNALIKD